MTGRPISDDFGRCVSCRHHLHGACLGWSIAWCSCVCGLEEGDDDEDD